MSWRTQISWAGLRSGTGGSLPGALGKGAPCRPPTAATALQTLQKRGSTAAGGVAAGHLARGSLTRVASAWRAEALSELSVARGDLLTWGPLVGECAFASRAHSPAEGWVPLDILELVRPPQRAAPRFQGCSQAEVPTHRERARMNANARREFHQKCRHQDIGKAVPPRRLLRFAAESRGMRPRFQSTSSMISSLPTRDPPPSASTGRIPSWSSSASPASTFSASQGDIGEEAFDEEADLIEPLVRRRERRPSWRGRVPRPVGAPVLNRRRCPVEL